MLGMVEIVSRRGKPIRSVKEWGVEAPPARALAGRPQREGTSKGLDRRQRLEALISLLDRDPATAGLRIESAVAETQTAFDRWPGGKRNHDLLVTGRAAGGDTVIALEGKADESFGQTFSSYAAGAQRRIDRREAAGSGVAPNVEQCRAGAPANHWCASTDGEE